MRNAEDDARAAHEAEARKVADLEKAQSNVAANEKILADSQMELKEAQVTGGIRVGQFLWGYWFL